MRTLRLLLFAIPALAIALVLLLFALLHASRPDLEGIYYSDELDEAVHVRFDSLARPFVEASNLEDALFAQGYLHASHRLWQMETLRRAGKGRLAELLGEEALATDRELWRFGVPTLTKKLAANASSQLAKRVKSYVKGVNLGLAQYRVLPPEFLLLRQSPEPWTDSDVFAVGAMTAFQSSGNASNELLRLALLDTLAPEQFSVFLDDNSEREGFPFILKDMGGLEVSRSGPQPGASARGVTAGAALGILQQLAAVNSDDNPLMPRLRFGSNGWVLGPQKSTNGNALFAFDSHDSLGLPNLFYEVHLFFDEGREIRGWSVPGLPGVINGFNERIAWGFTNIGDTQDLFLEKTCAEGRGFMAAGQCNPVRSLRVEIPVRGREEPDVLDIQFSINGPLLSEAPPISVSWTAHHIDERGLDAILALNLARNPSEIKEALDDWAAPSLNATWADVDGNIGFRTAGLLPLRGAGQGLFPLRGDQAEYHWQGFVNPEDMPRITNPPEGYLAAANARVNSPDAYPLVSADNASPYRIQRLQDVLGEERSFSADEMRELQMDWTDGQAELLLPTLLTDLEGQFLSEPADRAREILKSWQERPLANPESAAALLFQAWYLVLASQVFESSLGPDLFAQLLKHNYLLNHALDTLLLSDRHQAAWPEMQAPFRGMIAAEALEITVRDLQSLLGADPSKWRLDALQKVVLEHELGSAVPALAWLFSEPERAWGGSPATLGRAGYDYGRAFRVKTGATVRTVAEMGDVPRVTSVIPGGQSGHPLSPHYNDQFDAWLEGRQYAIANRPAELKGPGLLLRPRDETHREE